jgi:glycogen debranching enzyme
MREEPERKHRVLTRGTPSITDSIADAVVFKDGDLFLLTRPDGSIPLHHAHGYGLYYHDCRFLNGYELRLGGSPAVPLGSTAAAGERGAFELTNPDLRIDGRTTLHKEGISLRWERRLDGVNTVLSDRLVLQNWQREIVEASIELRFRTAFEDLFQVRGLLRKRLGKLHQPEWRDGRLEFRYDGRDGVTRRLTISLSGGLERAGPTGAQAVVRLAPRGTAELGVELAISQSADAGVATPRAAAPLDFRVRSDSLWLNRVAARAGGDLDMLRSSIQGLEFFAAGVPWFTTLFGRDSLIAALQVLPFQPELAAQTLRLLALYQGDREDNWRDEQPGKILHEFRRGEMARAGAIPHTPYYGTVDATLLFLILLGNYTAWTGDLALFEELKPNVDRALEWMQRYGDGDGDGYIEYKSTSEHGLINQGWKDSGDAIVDADGELADPPISLVEVQGYAYEARRQTAMLFRRSGDEGRAERLIAEAETLRERFNRDFWLPAMGFYALALGRDKHPVSVVSSNPGHALWAGIADQEKAAATVRRLMADDMFSGWGVRTLSAMERGYNPVGYHLGTVWPHDNAFLAAGCRRYGFDQAAMQIFVAVCEAASYFEHDRLPELFAGFSRAEFDAPIRYPVACHPQAWAAGSVPYLLQVMLGLVPEGFERRLRVVNPLLPDGVDFLELGGVRVAGAPIGLRFGRNTDGSVGVETLVGACDVTLAVEPRARGSYLAP